MTVQPTGDGLEVVLNNDHDEEWTGVLLLRRVGFEGEQRAATEIPMTVDARGAARIRVPDDIGRPGDAATELVVAEATGIRGLWWFAEPRDSALADPGLTAEVRRVEGETFDVTITAGGVVRDLTLLVDRLNSRAAVDRGLVSLLPGERAVFRISGVSELDATSVLAPLVARSGNQLAQRR